MFPKGKSHRTGVILFCLCILIAAPPVGAQEVSDFRSHYSFFKSIYPRIEGSAGERQAVDYISGRLSELGIQFQAENFYEVGDRHSYSTSLEVFYPGTTSDELIIAAPLNTRENIDDIDDGAANLALALHLAEQFHKSNSNLGLRILFLGAEFGEEEHYPIGTYSFLSGYSPKGNSAVLYLGFQFPPERIILRAGDRDFISPYWLVERCTELLKSADLFYLARGNESQFFRLGVAKNPAPIRPFLDSGFPAVSLHSNSAPLPEDRIDEWVSAFTDFVGAMAAIEDVPTDWDRHYLFFQARSFTTILTERVYVIIFLVLTGMLILYPVVRPARFKSYVMSIVKNFWALPMMLILVFGLLLVGTLLIEGISSLKGFPGYWTTKPALFFILKISTAVFLFSLMSRYLKRLPFPKRGRFYSAGVLLILVSDIFILGIIDISLAYYVLWATIWAFLFSLTPKRGLKVLCLVISPIWLLKAAFDIFTIPTLEIAELLILSRNTGNLIIAFILFPFLLMLVRLDFMFRHPRKRNKRILLTLTYAILGLGCVGLSTYLSLLTPFSPETPQEIDVREIQDISKKTSYIKLTSPAALGDIAVNTGNQSHEISSSNQTYSIDIPLRKDILEIEINTSRFLGRVKYTLILNSAGTPSSIRLHMISDEEIIIYDSSFPFSFGKPGSAQIHIGRYPPNPLQIEITLPDAQRGVFEISAEYLDPPYSHDVAGENIAVNRTMMVVQQVAFGQEN